MIDRALHSFAYCLDYLREQIADVEHETLFAQPDGMVNHPAWVLGHLTYSCQSLGGEIGLAAWLPAEWGKLFGTGSDPASKPDGFPSKKELLHALDDAQSRISVAVARLDDVALNTPLPDARAREALPTIGHAVVHVLVAHAASHVGQVTVWRRLIGLPRVSRPFL